MFKMRTNRDVYLSLMSVAASLEGKFNVLLCFFFFFFCFASSLHRYYYFVEYVLCQPIAVLQRPINNGAIENIIGSMSLKPIRQVRTTFSVS